VRGMSIGYREIDVEPSTNGDPTKLVKLDILEASIVSFPANRRAAVEAVKSESEQNSIRQWSRFEEFARKLRDGEPMLIKEFEDILREAGVPRSVARDIASVGYAKAMRCEAVGGEAKSAITEAIASMRSLAHTEN
jgi:hypothetical protein